jgi:hypothetical protein
MKTQRYGVGLRGGWAVGVAALGGSKVKTDLTETSWVHLAPAMMITSRVIRRAGDEIKKEHRILAGNLNSKRPVGTAVFSDITHNDICQVFHYINKVKVKVSRYTPWRCLGGGGISTTHSRPRHYMGVSGQYHAPAALYPRGIDTHWTGGWVGPRTGLGAETGRKILCLCRGSNPGRPVRSQTLCWLSYPGSCFTT